MANPITIEGLKKVVRQLHAQGKLGQVSLYVSGPPGIGKSAMFEQLARELGADHKVFLACTFDPTDVSGVPVPMVNDNMTRFLPPERLLKLTERYDPGRFTVAVFDDLPACHEQVFVALFRLFHERYVGEAALRKDVLMAATGNRVGDMAGARELPTALANRFVHYEIRVDAEEWRQWAVLNGIHPMVIGFVQTSGPRFLHDFDPSRGDVCFPSPRSVAYASLMYEALENTDTMTLLTTMAGCCGESWAHAFLTYAELKEKLVPIDEIFARPETAPVPEVIDVTYAVLANVTCAVAKNTNAAWVNAAVKYASRIPERDMAAKAIRDVVNMVKGKPKIYADVAETLAIANKRYGNLYEMRGSSD